MWAAAASTAASSTTPSTRPIASRLFKLEAPATTTQ